MPTEADDLWHITWHINRLSGLGKTTNQLAATGDSNNGFYRKMNALSKFRRDVFLRDGRQRVANSSKYGLFRGFFGGGGTANGRQGTRMDGGLGEHDE